MGWLSNYKYRKEITLSRASGAVTNYQMKLLVGESAGATGEDVDCGGKCLSSFNDIRFTASDGTTLLDYWIESISGATPNQLATIWIEFNSIGTGATTFYMYYGNSGAPAYSNGADTFILFDDFEWGADTTTLETSGGSPTWTKAGSGNMAISTEKYYGGSRSVKVAGQGNTPQYSTPLTASNNIAIRYRLYKEGNTTNVRVFYGDASNYMHIFIYDDEQIGYFGETGTWSGQYITADTWQLVEINKIDYTNQTYSIDLNGSNIINVTGMANGGTYNNILLFYSADYNAGDDWWFDNVLVRNYRAIEPAWGTWGAEESGGFVPRIIII